MQYFEAQRARGGALIVVDPRRTPTAQAATLHLPLAPGIDAALANGLLHVLIRDGLVDRDYIRSAHGGLRAAPAAVAAAYWPGRVERITGVPEADLVRAARLLGTARSVDGAHRARRRAAGAGRRQHARVHQHRARAGAGRAAPSAATGA